MRSALFGLVAAAGLLVATQGMASVTVYTSRDAFIAATPGATTVEDFGNDASFPIPGGVLNAMSAFTPDYGAPVVAGQIKAGVTYSTPAQGGGEPFYFNIDQGGSGFEGGFLDTLDTDRALTFTFDAPQAGFGFDYSAFSTAFILQLYNADGLIFEGNFARPDDLGFVGFNSSAGDIVSAVLTGDGTDSAFGVDNVTFQGSAAPEPGAWTLLLTGFAMAGHGLRRRRSADASVLRSFRVRAVRA